MEYVDDLPRIVTELKRVSGGNLFVVPIEIVYEKYFQINMGKYNHLKRKNLLLKFPPKDVTIEFRKNNVVIKQILNFLFLLVIQLLIENSVQFIFADNTIRLSFSFIFLIALSLLVYFNKFYLFFSLQLLSIFIYAFILLPHFYYFNFISFYTRINYLFFNYSQFFIPSLALVLGIVFLYFIILKQYLLFRSLKTKKLYLFLFLFTLVLLKSINPIYFSNSKNVLVTIINQNKLQEYQKDYTAFIESGKIIKNYSCTFNNNISPSIKYFYNKKDSRELLLILESWGELADTMNQNKCLDYIKDLFDQQLKESKQSYGIHFGRTCFHGNTAAAEGRELLNINDEESYRAVFLKDILPVYNLVDFKNRNDYYTISAFSGSKKYGSNWSNAEGFRKKMGFKSRLYFEDFRGKFSNNNENSYQSVFDEDMIDSLINYSNSFSKVFAYGLTINTHQPFHLDMKNVNSVDYTLSKSKLSKYFKDNTNTFNHFYRISKILSHIFKTIAQNKYSFDKVIIIGDHANPDLISKKIYNQETVPYILIQKKE